MPSGSGRVRAAFGSGAERAGPVRAAGTPRPAKRGLLVDGRLAVMLLVIVCAGDARAQFERSAMTPRAVATGGAYASVADDVSSIFVNPAGLVSVAGPIVYGDYAEVGGARGGREARAAAAVDARYVQCALAWYRLDGDGGAEDLFVAGCARKLLSGSQSSYVAVGANVEIGRVAGPAMEDGSEPAWTDVAADAGIVVRPLPVVSFAWAVGNLFEADSPADGREETWSRSNRLGVSYFWEDALVLSFESRRAGGETTRHYGVLARAAVPIEILFGLSAGEMTGGARWTGKGVRLAVAFDGGGAGETTWMVALEGSFGGGAGKGDR